MRLGAVIVHVRDVGAAVEFYERAFGLERGAVQGDDEKPWGQDGSYVRDPDGTLEEICSEWRDA